VNFIGNEKSFGVQYEYDHSPESPECDSWLYGKLAFLVGGERVGNYDVGTSIRDGVTALRGLLANRGNRSDPELFQLPAGDVIARILAALYVEKGQSDEQVAADWKYFSRFLGVPAGYDAFDGWDAVLLEDDRSGRYIWRQMSSPNSLVREFRLARGELDNVIEQFLASVVPYVHG
jgi:hypothetical protein